MCQKIKMDDRLEKNAILPNTVKMMGLTSWRAISNIVHGIKERGTAPEIWTASHNIQLNKGVQ
jgi:hypothetical protein